MCRFLWAGPETGPLLLPPPHGRDRAALSRLRYEMLTEVLCVAEEKTGTCPLPDPQNEAAGLTTVPTPPLPTWRETQSHLPTVPGRVPASWLFAEAARRSSCPKL